MLSTRHNAEPNQVTSRLQEDGDSGFSMKLRRVQHSIKNNHVVLIIVVAALSVFSIEGAAVAQDRMPPISEDHYSEAQKKAAAEFAATRKTPVFGPFIPLIRSPELMLRAKNMGDYLRYKNSISPKLSEFTILIMAREWTQDYVWYVHYPLAIKAGLKSDIAEAIFEGRRPKGMSPDEETIYDFVTELIATKRVSDTTYEEAQKLVGDRGIIDLSRLQGYYTLIAMSLNVARAEPPTGSSLFPRLPN
jgi:4-carboxymuconolactone decarboxylase